MKKSLSLFVLAGLFVAFAASSALAVGIGAYIDAAGGEGYRKVKSRSLEDTGGTTTNYGFKAGLVFDTCVACDSAFSYRLKLGGGMTRSDFLTKTNYNSFHWSNTFAFALVKNDYVKFWMGPQIGLQYYRGSGDRLFIGTENPSAEMFLGLGAPWYYTGIFKERNRYSVFGADAGLAFGVNINLGDYVSLALEAGATYGYRMGTQNREVIAAIEPTLAFNSFNDRLTEHGIEGYGSVAVLFRFVDTYQ
jgi:hypothetical protein